MLVNTGSEYTWVLTKYLEEIGIEREKRDLEFVMANGQRITRSVGFSSSVSTNFLRLMRLYLRKKATFYC
jgi:hypothetical protein